MDKKPVRQELRLRILELPEKYIRASDESITSAVLALPEYKSAERIFAFYSVGREVNTHAIIAAALKAGKTVAIPVVLGGGLMEFAETTGSGDRLKTGQLAIPEPDVDAKRLVPGSGDLLLVPGLSFDLEGYRLGQGGGYYDRLLADCEALSVGLCRNELLCERVLRESHDLPVKLLVTDKITKRLR